jgi:hypothetical protein
MSDAPLTARDPQVAYHSLSRLSSCAKQRQEFGRDAKIRFLSSHTSAERDAMSCGTTELQYDHSVGAN